MMPDDSATSVYALVNVLCESLTRDYCSNKSKIETSARKLKSRAYEILLKKSNSPVEINDAIIVDPLRDLDVKRFEYDIEASTNPEQKAACVKFNKCLEFIEEESYFRTETAKAILTFLVSVSDAVKPADGNGTLDAESPLLIPGPFTLHANYNAVSHYPPAYNSNTNLEPTFKSFQLLKKYKNFVYEPEFKFADDIKSVTKSESTFSIQTSTTQQKSSTISSSTNHQETWKCGLNINPSLYRFFNEQSQSKSSFVKSDGTQKSLSTIFKSTTSTSNAVAIIPQTSRLTFNWSWESMGHVVPSAPDFVSETGGVLHLQATRATMIGGNFEAKIVRFDQFLADLKNLTIGIQSESFKYDDVLIFTMESNITVADISPGVMNKFILPFIECGSCYKRLQLMTAKKNLPFLFDGFIFKATCSAIEEYLLKFRQFVVLFKDTTLLEFYKRMKKMMRQITYLAHIFAIHPNVDIDVRPPMGSQFLGYLYKEITNTTQKDIIMLLVYILKQCCYAYFKYIQKWTFHGELDDPRNELFISFIDHYRVNTKYFFDKAYYIRKESVPGFLQGFEDKILQCGKYTMLLKAFNPAHPIFSLNAPSITVCLSFDEIQKMEDSCRNYMQQSRDICGKPVTVGDIFEERRESRKRFKEMVQEKSRLNIEKWSVDCESQASEETARKRKRLEELQEHLKSVRERKLMDKKNDLALDLKILKEAQDIEDKRLAQENVEIQKRIEYYQQLNAIIEERKSRVEASVVTSSSNLKIDTDPGTPVSTTTDFESCLGEDEVIDEEDLKSIYEDASTSADFLEKFLEAEKKLNEYLEATNNNNDDREIRRSASDVLNSNEIANAESQANKAKILGSSLSTIIGEQSQEKGVEKTTVTSTVLTEAQKIKLKVLSSEFGMDLNSNKTDDEPTVKPTTSTTLSDLAINRKKMMQNDLFANLNSPVERKMLQLDLNTERSRNRRRVLESEYNIITGVCSNKSTPMSTTSDSPMFDENEEDMKNANVLRLIVPPRSKWNNINTPDMDTLTAATIEETPECGLNTAGVMARKGFDFKKPNEDSNRTVPNIINLESQDLLSIESGTLVASSENQPCQGYNPQFKWKPVSEILSLNRKKSCMNLSPAEEKQVNDLNVITLTEFLQKSVLVPVSAHLEIMNCEIMGLYLKDLDILGHFKSLRNYFFLMDGEFSSIVCDGLISKLENGANPNELLSYRMLHTILDNALGSSDSGNDKNAENLSFIVSELPEKFDLASSEVLSSLSLSYRVAWPVSLILNPETLDKYSKIFKYLIKVRRISWVLEESYQRLKEIVKKNGKEMLRSPQYRSVQQIRHKFFHFIHALNNHITSSALQASWKTFKDDLVLAKSVEDIYRKHTTYIKRILFLCMLNKKSMEFYNAIENIFKVTLRFSRNLKSREWKRRGNDEFFTHSRYERLLADEIEFEKCIRYTIYLGNKIVRYGYQEEIGEFINLINFNHYYLVDM